MSLPPDAHAVLDFWFGAPGSETYGQQRKLWFVKSEETDARIRSHFGALTDAAISGACPDWGNSPRASLAIVLLLDQFARNIHRNTPRAFAGDAQALAIAKRMVTEGDDQALLPVERIFAYLPFEHAEDIGEQRMSLRLFRALASEHTGFDSTLDYAQRHHAVIERFSRFPHRNAILGRTSTPDEADYLAQPGSGF